MNKRVTHLIILLLAALSLPAQELAVKSMEVAAGDLTASVRQRNDLNGNACAMVRVMLKDKAPRFEGNVLGEVQKEGMSYLVYMSAGTKFLKIVPEEHFPLMIAFADHGIKRLESKVTYNLKVVEQEAGSSESKPASHLAHTGLQAIKITLTKELFSSEDSWELSKAGNDAIAKLAELINKESGLDGA